MTTLRKSMMIGLLAIGLGTGSMTVWAEKGGPDGGQGRPGHAAQGEHKHSPERMKQAFERRQQNLHDKLKLDAKQEAAWKSYVDTIRPSAPVARPDRAELARLPAPERMQKMMDRLQEREQKLALRIAATKEFYAVLTPEQQKVFDAEFMAGRRHHMRGHHGTRGEKS